MPRLLLINPKTIGHEGFFNVRATRFMPLGLGILAALTPQDWNIEFIDEAFEDVTFREADLVAITSFTSNSSRAYEIATLFRKSGIRTIYGGVHATMCTSEALNYFDSVFRGEAEGAWDLVIKDFIAGKLSRVYDGGIVDTEKIASPRREIFRKYPYSHDLVQTSRGCPWGCSFCSVTHVFGHTYRERDIEVVLSELEASEMPMIFFVDDNLVNHKKGSDERAIRLFKGIVERKIKKQWISQVAMNFADNEEVLYWAQKSGCTLVLMGIEADSEDALKDLNKKLNLKRGVRSYDETFRKLHKHGIGILAAIIFGTESDKREDLYTRLEFIKKCSADCFQITILTPFPGTPLFDKLKAENKITFNNYPSDWQHYHTFRSVWLTQHFSHEELESIMTDIWNSVYNKAYLRKRLFRTLAGTKNFMTTYWAYFSNFNYGRMCLDGKLPDDSTLKWSDRLFIRLSDGIMWLIYKLVWTKMIRKLN